MISSAEAALLLSKFESEEILLFVNFFSQDRAINLTLHAHVADSVEGESLALFTSDKHMCLISLKGCRFEYADERSAPEFLREWATQKYDGMLKILFPSNETMTLRALRGNAETTR